MDSEIVQKIGTKNKKALEQLYVRYERTVYTLAFRIVGDSRKAENIVLQIFSEIWNSNGELLERGQTLSVQMLKITRQFAYDERRKEDKKVSPSPCPEKTCFC
ncbi:MAG TPA: sigma factor [Bacillales bacterium]|nr:sigma factor [Bacillales bacterium]